MDLGCSHPLYFGLLVGGGGYSLQGAKLKTNGRFIEQVPRCLNAFCLNKSS